ncbi:MAG: recombinase family protein [Pseudobdellovibrionaceae bacterium]
MKTANSVPYKRVAIATRASTQELADAETLRQQENICREYVESLAKQTGIPHKVVEVFVEEGVSGASKKRPVMDRLILKVKTGQIDAIVTKELSRLFRSLTSFLNFCQLCRTHGVALYIRNLPDLNPNTATGSMVLSVLAAISVFEREICIERVKDTLRSAALRDSKINGGSVIYGFSRHPSKKGCWVPDTEELKNVEFLMKTFTEVGSLTETIKIAEKYGIKNKGGSSFGCTSLRKLFENRKFVGELRVIHGENDEQETFVPLPFGPVIDVALFDRVQTQLTVNDSARANLNRRGTKVYLFTGLLHHENGASYAGQSAICRNGRRKNYYYESKTKSRVDADQLEDRVLKNLCNSIEKEVELEKHAKSLLDSRDKKIEIISTEIKRVRVELDEIREKEMDILKGMSALGQQGSPATVKWLEDQVATVSRTRNENGERLERLECEREQLLKSEVNVKKYQNQALEIFYRMKKADPVQQRQFLRQVIEKIELNHSAEVRITWKFSGVFTGMEEMVASKQNWLRRRDSNPRPSG